MYLFIYLYDITQLSSIYPPIPAIKTPGKDKHSNVNVETQMPTKMYEQVLHMTSSR